MDRVQLERSLQQIIEFYGRIETLLKLSESAEHNHLFVPTLNSMRYAGRAVANAWYRLHFDRPGESEEAKTARVEENLILAKWNLLSAYYDLTDSLVSALIRISALVIDTFTEDLIKAEFPDFKERTLRLYDKYDELAETRQSRAGANESEEDVRRMGTPAREKLYQEFTGVADDPANSEFRQYLEYYRQLQFFFVKSKRGTDGQEFGRDLTNAELVEAMQENVSEVLSYSADRVIDKIAQELNANTRLRERQTIRVFLVGIVVTLAIAIVSYWAGRNTSDELAAEVAETLGELVQPDDTQ